MVWTEALEVSEALGKWPESECRESQTKGLSKYLK